MRQVVRFFVVTLDVGLWEAFIAPAHSDVPLHSLVFSCGGVAWTLDLQWCRSAMWTGSGAQMSLCSGTGLDKARSSVATSTPSFWSERSLERPGHQCSATVWTPLSIIWHGADADGGMEHRDTWSRADRTAPFRKTSLLKMVALTYVKRSLSGHCIDCMMLTCDPSYSEQTVHSSMLKAQCWTLLWESIRFPKRHQHSVMWSKLEMLQASRTLHRKWCSSHFSRREGWLWSLRAPQLCNSLWANAQGWVGLRVGLGSGSGLGWAQGWVGVELC